MSHDGKNLERFNIIHNRKLNKKDKFVEIYGVDIERACDVVPRQQEWLWENYIPLKTCTLFAGAGGIGKSQLLLYFAALVSVGNDFRICGQNFKIGKGSVLVLTAEDSLSSSVVPRLRAVDADLTKIHFVKSTTHITATIDQETGESRNPTSSNRFIALDRDIHIIETEIKRIGDVKLIIIDPITAYLGNIKDNKLTEIRDFILRLNRLADDNDISIILNTHLRKKGSGQSAASAADEVMGSSAWTSTVRQAFIICPHHDDKSLVQFINFKINCGKAPQAFAYKIVPQTVVFDETNGGKTVIDTSRIEWNATKVTMSADEAVSEVSYERKKEGKGIDFIIDYLTENGQSIVQRVYDEAIAYGISKATFYRARTVLIDEQKRVLVTKGVRAKMWQLRDEAL
jgi:hypothetical protein